MGGPCVAQRVCAMPIEPVVSVESHAFLRLATLPACFTTLMAASPDLEAAAERWRLESCLASPPVCMIATPAES